MKLILKIFIFKFFIFFYLLISYSFSDNHNIYEVLEKIQTDMRVLEKAVYSETNNINSENSNEINLGIANNSEDVLTRHLLKLSEIEAQFQKLTNKFEEIVK